MESNIEITFGEVNDASAEVVVSYCGNVLAESAQVSITGFVRGPFCKSGRTLTADYPFRQRADARLSAAAIITDPCFWAPNMPHLYSVNVRVVSDGQLVDQMQTDLGLHRTSPRRAVDFAPGTG